MRVPLSWLKDYVDIDITGEELAEKLTAAGVSVENVEYAAPDITGVFTGHISKIRPHPNADKLVLCDVDFGGSESVQIVTGAPNVREGHRVPVALHGANLAGGLKIKRSKIRGEKSEGMLCSATELGLDGKDLPQDQREGVMIFPPHTKPGESVIELLCLNDPVLVVETFANRPDQLSILGIAAETAAVTGKTLKTPPMEYEEIEESCADLLQVKIEDYNMCKKYSGRIIRDMPSGPSPLWMQGRLNAAGIRSVSNVVDITNYVMIETGQPLHAFDFNRVRGAKIIVRPASPGETIVNIDEKKRILDADMLVIADESSPVALAGVMGGIDSEISSETRNILLESANFNQASVRRTSIKLGLRSESSRRFEKGIDFHQVEIASKRASYLLWKFGGKVLKGEAMDSIEPPAPEVIRLRPRRVNRILGTDMGREAVKQLLSGLGFHIEEDGEDFLVRVPTVRQDIKTEIDLIEETARLYGYDNIPTTSPTGVAMGGVAEAFAFDEMIRDLMARCGLYECITLSLHEEKALDDFGMDGSSLLRVVNPITGDQAVLRNNAVYHLTETVKRNIAVKRNLLKLFEVSKFYEKGDNPEPDEKRELTLLLTGPGQTPDTDFFHLKGIIDYLLDVLNIEGEFIRGKIPYLHPNKTAVILSGDEELGVMGIMHPGLLKNRGIDQEIVIARLSLDSLRKLHKLDKFAPISRFPGIQRDIAVTVDKDTPAGRVERIALEKGSPIIREAYCFDVYQGRQISDDKKSLAFSLTFTDPCRTLTDQEVQEKIDAILASLKEELGAVLRG